MNKASLEHNPRSYGTNPQVPFPPRPSLPAAFLVQSSLQGSAKSGWIDGRTGQVRSESAGLKGFFGILHAYFILYDNHNYFSRVRFKENPNLLKRFRQRGAA